MIELANENEKALINTGNDLVYLISCILNDIEPDKERLERINLEQLLKISKFHLLTSILCMEIEKTQLFEKCQNKELVKNWKDSKNKAIRKVLLLDAQRQKILNFFEENQIWYLPLKGIYLKEMYPKIGMRQMADNDILYDSKYQDKLYKYMKKEGYSCKQYKKSNHDVYHKPPIYNFEMHNSLCSHFNEDIFLNYYKNVKERLIKDEDNQYGYHFSDEDFYIFYFIHAYKHYQNGGTGLRTLLDIYIYLNKYSQKLEFTYIENELKKLEIFDFEQTNRSLAKKLFAKENYQLDDSEREMYLYYLSSGTYGTVKHNVHQKLMMNQTDEKFSKKAKMKYLLRRIFPDMKYFELNAPFVYRHKYLIPFFYIYRIFRMPFTSGKSVMCEFKEVYKAKK